ncbi:MAG TPA: hypothetical protein VD862_02245 [Candidatus Paceibacterota bacterium]|nr:hypothetical protein [Candidatus Paceibacterota bacterium]
MAGTKIINVLRDDSFKDILDLFRKTDAEDVVFVLPKRSAVFRREDHFAAFASESKRANRNVSILCANADVNDWARKYGFTVITKSRPSTKTAAALTDDYNDEDEEVRDPNTDAFDDDVAVPGGEKDEITDTGEEEEMEGYHVEEDEEAPKAGKPAADGDEDEPDLEDEDYSQTRQRYGPNDMDLYDAEGNLIIKKGSGVVATLAAAKVIRPLDAVRSPEKGTGVSVKGRTERPMKVGVKATPVPESEDDAEPSFEEILNEAVSSKTAPRPAQAGKEAPQTDEDGDLDYIDAVWRDRVNGSRQTPAAKPKGWRTWFGSGQSKEPGGAARKPGGGSHRMRNAVSGAVAAVVLIGGAFMVLNLGKAAVTIVPVSRDLEFQISVQTSDAFGSVDSLFNKIPGQLFEIEREADREFPATGSEEVAAKAKGKITISSTLNFPQTLIATTRFESSGGLIFRTLQTVTVPAASGDAPGTVTVDVIADKPGAEYNIEGTDFVVAAFREQGDTERFEGITGDSVQTFVGGALGLAKVVTQEDLDNATAAVREELTSQVRQAFEAQASGLKLVNDAEIVIEDLAATHAVDDAGDTFRVTATGKLTTVGFRESDLFTLLDDYTRRSWQLSVVPDLLTVQYDNVRFVEDRAILAFDVTVLGKGFVPVSTEEVIADIQGLSKTAVRDYFKSAENVRSSTVVLSPIWVRSVPKDASRITVDIQFTDPITP